MFVPLHVKSDYSLGYGTSSIDSLVSRAAALGYRSLALTDLESLAGQVHFHHACRAHSVRPITGLELRPGFDGRKQAGGREGRVVLIAKDRTGYANLCRIVSRRRGAVATGRDCPSAGPDLLPLLAANGRGLFVLSDDPSVVTGLGARSFPSEGLGMLLVRPGDAESDRLRIDTARRLGVRLVADLDVVFLEEGDRALHVMQLAIRLGRTIQDVACDPVAERKERWLRDPAGAERLFAEVPDAVRAAAAIAEACSFDLTALKVQPPALRGSDEDAGAKLRHRCEEVINRRSTTAAVWTEPYRTRLALELATFERLGLSGFFLVIDEILGYCRKQAIPVLLRGSAASSLTLHLLGATPVDPLAHGLIFERFLHEGKSTWPDADLDLPWHRRDEVIDWVYSRFGRDHVAMVGAYHTFQRRSAVREGLKAMGTPQTLIGSALAALPPDGLDATDIVLTGQVLTDRQVNGADGQDDAGAGAGDGDHGHLIERLIDRPRHVAAHPGGVVISRSKLDGLLPLEVAPKGVVITQYDMEAVAHLGLIKLDLLGNRCLSEVEETTRLSGTSPPVRLDGVPLDDRATLALVDRAATVGCFQLESPAMRALLARLPIRTHEDIVAALALIRPGAAAGRAKEAFIRRARGEDRGPRNHPILGDRLAATQGLLLYEEDLIVLLSRAGGISLAAADELRAAIVASGGEPRVLAGLELQFVEKALGNGAWDREHVRLAWAEAVRFAAYSFNKAHAVSYACLAYLSGFMKAHYPVQFACALLDHHEGAYPLRTVAAEFQRMGVGLRLPHVNGSRYESHVEEQGVRIGLGKIKVLSRKIAARLLHERSLHGPFTAVSDLLERLHASPAEIAALVLSGACDGLPPLTADAYPFVHEAVVQRVRQGLAPGEVAKVKILDRGRTKEQEERVRLYRGLVRVRNELRYLGMHLTAHPMALLRQEAGRYGCLPLASVRAVREGSKVLLAGTVAALRRVPTGAGPMQFLALEDETGLLEAVIPPPAYARMGERVTTPGPFLLEGKIRHEYEAVFLEAIEVSPFYKRQHPFHAKGPPP